MKFKPGTIEIERAHRAKNSNKYPKPVVVKLLRYQDREAILRNGKTLKNTGIFISDDVSERVQARRKEQLPKLKEARNRGKQAYFVMDRLVIKDRKPRHDDVTDATHDQQTYEQQTDEQQAGHAEGDGQEEEEV
jgi:hypothetical protein